MILDCNHSFSVKFLYALPNLSILWLVVIKIEPCSPVTEITWKNEYSLGIVKIRSKYFTIFVGHLFINRAGADRNYFNFLA